MAEQDLKPVSSATATFAVLAPQEQVQDRAGNDRPETGMELPDSEPTRPDMEELARALNLESQSIGRDLRFEVDMESGHSVIQVLDRETGEIIRQIPPEKTAFYVSGSGSLQLRLYDELV